MKEKNMNTLTHQQEQEKKHFVLIYIFSPVRHFCAHNFKTEKTHRQLIKHKCGQFQQQTQLNYTSTFNVLSRYNSFLFNAHK